MTNALSLRSLVQSLTRATRKARKLNRSGTSQLRLETLEELTLPATISWINPAGGDWAVAANWSSGTIPGAADDAIINLPGDYAVTHSTGNHTVRSLTSYRQFRMTGGSLRMQQASHLYGPVSMNLGFLTADAPLTFHRDMSFTGGTMQGAGDVDFRGVLTWSGGLMTGTGVTHTRDGIRFTFTGNNGVENRTVNNYGLTSWSGTGRLNLREGAIFNNMSGAMFLVQNAATFLGDSAARGGVFNNYGTFRVDAGAANFVRQPNQAGVVFNNFHQVHLNGGDLRLERGGVTRGLVHIGYNRNLILPTETFTFNSGSTVSGEGTIRVHGATVQVNNEVHVRNVELTSGQINAVGTFTMNGHLVWSGGRFWAPGNVYANSGMTIQGPAAKTFQGGTLRHTGMAAWTGGDLIFSDASFVNTMGSTFDIRTDSNFGVAGAFTSFQNYGTLQKSAGMEITTLNASVTNHGTLAVRAGQLDIGGVDNRSSMTVAEGTTLALYSVYAPAGSSLTGAGNVIFGNYSSEVAGLYEITGHTQVVGGVIFSSMAQTGSLLNQGVVAVVAGGHLTVAGDYMQEPLAGTYLQDSTITVGGTLENQGGIAGTGTINGNVLNAGRVIVGDIAATGLLTINGNFTQTVDAVLEMEFGSALTGYDRLVINGTATLDGTLNIMLLEDFATNLDDNYHILTYTDRAGEFGTINGQNIGGGLCFHARYGASGLDLWVVEV